MREHDGTIIHSPAERSLTMPSGIRHDLIISANGLGWLNVKAATDKRAILKFIQQRNGNDGDCALGMAYVRSTDVGGTTTEPSLDTANPVKKEITPPLPSSLDAPSPRTLAPFPLPAGVGMGRPAVTSALAFLKRMHVTMGHASLDSMLRTIGEDFPERTASMTKAVLEEYKAEGCGICETDRMRMRAVKSLGPSANDKYLPGKRFTFD